MMPLCATFAAVAMFAFGGDVPTPNCSVSVNLGGSVYDDANGLTDGLVNGAATNATGLPLYVNLLNSNNNVLATTAVATNGSYQFNNLATGAYVLQLTTNWGTVGGVAPAMGLPSNWVYTGESTNGIIVGTPNGWLPICLQADITCADFGIDRLPTSLATNASHVNPGLGNPVPVPALLGTDPEQGALGGTTNKVVIKSLPGNGMLYYGGTAVTLNQVITGYNPAQLTFAPAFNGVGTSTFTFAIEDLAGAASAAPATVTLTFTALTLGGTVYDDANGLSDGLVNGVGTNIKGTLYANLITGGVVVTNVAIAASGAYTFTNLGSLTYTVQLSTVAGCIGAAQPVTALPATWVNTGESTNGTLAGTPNGLITVKLVTSLATANFGIDQLPTSLATNASYVNTGTPVTVPGLLGTDPEQGNLGDLTNVIKIATLPVNGTLKYNGVAVTANQSLTNFSQSLLTFTPSFTGAGTASFTFNIEDAAHQPSTSPATVTLTFTALSLGGTVLDDTNGLLDGVVNGTGTNAGGLYAVLISGGNEVTNMAVAASGAYNFINLNCGVYTVELSTVAGAIGAAAPAMTLPANWVNTGESTNGTLAGTPNGLITVTMTHSLATANFGIAQSVTIGGYTWLDVNKNGLQDSGEPSLGGVAVVLSQTNTLTQTMTAIATDLSSPNGTYEFTNLPPGGYQLRFIAPAGDGYSPALQGSNPAMNSHADPTTGDTPILVCSPGTVDLTENAGFMPSPTAVAEVGLQASVVSGQIWLSWQTYSEAGLLAFDVTRTAANGVVEDVTPDYVFASGQDAGAKYSVLDAGATIAGGYTYQLYGYYDDLSMERLATATVPLSTSVVPTPSQPSLSLQITSGGVRLSWNGGQPPYVVEQSTSLGAGAAWQAVGPATTNTEITVPLTGQSSFFRIHEN